MRVNACEIDMKSTCDVISIETHGHATFWDGENFGHVLICHPRVLTMVLTEALLVDSAKTHVDFGIG